MNTTEEEKFFDIFKGGVASLCVDVLRKKYNLGFLKRSRNNTDGGISYISFLRWIVERKDTVNVDFGKLFKEIKSNLSSCPNDTERDIYVRELIAPFANYLRATRPVENKTGNSEERAQEIEIGFYNISQKFGENVPGVVNLYKECEDLLERYTQQLDWVLMQRGIDLLEIQRENGIYLLCTEHRMPYDYVPLAGSVKAAEMVIEKINKMKGDSQETAPKVNTILDIFKNDSNFMRFCSQDQITMVR